MAIVFIETLNFFKEWVIFSNLRHVERHSVKRKHHGKEAERWGKIAFLLAPNLTWQRASDSLTHLKWSFRGARVA